MPDPEFDARIPAKETQSQKLERRLARLRTHERLIVASVAALQVAILVGMVVADTVPWRGSGVTTVLLRVVPVDPRDLMRGEYVTLGYDISGLPAGGIPGLPPDRTQRAGLPVYVSLIPDTDGRHYHAGAWQGTPFDSGLFIQGTVSSWGRVNYGIESFYVQEGRGKEYEQSIRSKKLSAEVAVTRGGRASILRLILE